MINEFKFKCRDKFNCNYIIFWLQDYNDWTITINNKEYKSRNLELIGIVKWNKTVSIETLFRERSDKWEKLKQP